MLLNEYEYMKHIYIFERLSECEDVLILQFSVTKDINFRWQQVLRNGIVNQYNRTTPSENNTNIRHALPVCFDK